MHVVTPSITLRGSVVSFHQPWVMGILNLTPDSFHDGGAWDKPAAALAQADRMLAEGADMLDLGAHHLDLMFSHPSNPPCFAKARAIEEERIKAWIQEAYDAV